jgi:putative effector of murein hydrolase
MNSSPIRIAIVGALIVIIYGLLLHFTGNSYNKSLTNLSNIIVIATIALGIYFFKKNDNNGVMTFKEGFWAGMRATLIFSLIGSIWMIIFIKFISPDFINTMKQMQMDEMIKKGMTDEQIEVAMPMINKFMTLPFMFIIGFITYTFIGTITAAISSGIMKNRSSDSLPA